MSAIEAHRGAFKMGGCSRWLLLRRLIKNSRSNEKVRVTAAVCCTQSLTGQHSD